MPGRNLRLLSLDGGGVRGLSSLYILKQLMEVMTAEERRQQGGSSKPPKPCEYFDMIGGTSTGGWVCSWLFIASLHIYMFSHRRLGRIPIADDHGR